MAESAVIGSAIARSAMIESATAARASDTAALASTAIPPSNWKDAVDAGIVGGCSANPPPAGAYKSRHAAPCRPSSQCAPPVKCGLLSPGLERPRLAEGCAPISVKNWGTGLARSEERRVGKE